MRKKRMSWKIMLNDVVQQRMENLTPNKEAGKGVVYYLLYT